MVKGPFPFGKGPFFAIKPPSGRRACTGGHWAAKEIERDAREEG